MTELTTTASSSSQHAARPDAVTLVSGPTLISTHQVRFGTAAAVGITRPEHRRWAAVFVSVAAAARTVFGHRPAPRRHYPARYAYLERSQMSREMGRL